MALIPSIALLGTGIGVAVSLVKEGRKDRDWAEFAAATTDPAIRMIEAFQFEREASMLYLVGVDGVNERLATSRKNSDGALTQLLAAGNLGDVSRLRSELTGDLTGVRRLYQELPGLRTAIDARAIPQEQAFTAFSRVIDTIMLGTSASARVAPNAGSAVELYRAIHPLRAAEAIAKSAAIGTTALATGQLSAPQLVEFTRHVGEARGQIAFVEATATDVLQTRIRAVTNSHAWQQLIAMEDSFIRRAGIMGTEFASADVEQGRPPSGTPGRNGTTGTVMPLTAVEWGNAAGQLRSQLLALWKDMCTEANLHAEAAGAKKASSSLYGGAVIAAVTVMAFLATLSLTNRMLRRMRRLREDTLELADRSLRPGEDYSKGKQIHTDVARTSLQSGEDEIGQIAEAFNRAHTAAFAAAVAEAETRRGVNVVFLDIARRSQGIVHRQLALLDRAEREEEDPSKLSLLFKLDHLATRARRNAENLAILGGEQPGRRWRNPVPLLELVRSAVAESRDYGRIRVGRFPEIAIAGSAVADLIHLLAELTDNATSYSPPESRVEISGYPAGAAAIIEISDQGLGMSDSELVERNQLLASPPDYGMGVLSGDTRLGLFVVATLASHHAISVVLGESDFGGVRATVELPAVLTTDEYRGPSTVQVTS